MSYRRLGRSLIRLAQILTEVHCEIGQIFQYNHIILRSQFTYNPQLFIFQADPTRIIGV